MQLAHRWLDQRLSLLEGVLAWLLIVIVIALFSRYTLLVFSRAEQAMINSTVININTGLNQKASFALMNGDVEFLDTLLLMNPMDIMTNNSINDIEYDDNQLNPLNIINNLSSAPSNYGGVVIDDSEPLLESGQWYYDQDDHVLFYKLDNSEFFKSDLDGSARIRYKIHLNYTDQDKDNVFNPSVDEFDSMKLQALDTFSWSF